MTSPGWTNEADVIAALRRRWTRGDLLRALADGTPWQPIAVPIRAPSAGEIGAEFARVQDWATGWAAVAPRRMRVEYRSVGGRSVGVNRVPCRAWIDTPQQLWALLGVNGMVRRFCELVELTDGAAPLLVARMAARPHRVLEHERWWPALIATVLWIDEHGNAETYPRQIDVPGVDTKFIETHRSVLCDLLDHHLPAERVDRTCPPASDFAGRYGLRRKPSYVRLRYLDPAHPRPFSELTVRADELARHRLPVGRVFIVENDTSYLAFPDTEGAVVMFGGGYAVTTLGPLEWLHDRELIYWGDIDTHGMRILHRIRAIFPHTRSMLMDHATLMSHRGQWVREDSPTTDALPLLDEAERRLYRDLVDDTLGESVRLEQERVRFSVVSAACRAISRQSSLP